MEIPASKMSQGENDYADVLQRLTSTISEKIGEGAQKTKIFSSARIYRVPKDLRKLKESAYTPRLIAIGPLHRNGEHLQTPMQHVKMSYADSLLCRPTVGMKGTELAKKKNAVLQECVAEMKELLDDAKKCYAEGITLDEEMLLVDGCFILEFLYRSRSLYLKNRAEEKGKQPIAGGDNGNSKGQETDPIFGNSLTIYTVENDLVLLENQIPFFVLEKLFRLTVGRIPVESDYLDKNSSLTDYVWWCYGNKMSPVGTSTKTWCSPSDCCLRVFGNELENTTTAKKEVLSADQYYHILHNLHDRYLPRDQTKQKPPGEVILMPSASELYFAGVKFVPDAGHSLFKFKFSEPIRLLWLCRRARFNIPPLAIFDHTELFLRNLIAFEQSCPGVSQNVTSYACVMDMLVNADKDVQVLEKEGVMCNYLGADEDATRLFNNLCKEIFEGEYYFADTCIEATEYSKRFWPTHIMAHVRRQYFASPWTFIAFIVGFIAFVISFVEFVRSFLKKEKGGCSCEGTKRWS